MSIYVDAPVEYAAEPPGYIGHARARARWCHMVADTAGELHAMAAKIGLRRQWAQESKRGVLHYDLVPTKRQLALKYGAVPLGRREFVAKIRTLTEAAHERASLERQVSYLAKRQTPSASD